MCSTEPPASLWRFKVDFDRGLSLFRTYSSSFWFPPSFSSSLGFYRNAKVSCLVYRRLPLSVSHLSYLILTCGISLLASICSVIFTVQSFGIICVQSRSPFTHVICHSKRPYIYQYSIVVCSLPQTLHALQRI